MECRASPGRLCPAIDDRVVTSADEQLSARDDYGPFMPPPPRNRELTLHAYRPAYIFSFSISDVRDVRDAMRAMTFLSLRAIAARLISR